MRGGRRDGRAFNTGETYDTNWAVFPGANNRGGGSHAGLGGIVGTGTTNATYGSDIQPTRLGSGGGTQSSTIAAGNGGGRVELTVNGALNVSGAIRADGGDAANLNAAAAPAGRC